MRATFFFDKWLFYCSLKGLFFCTIHYFNCYFLDFLGFRLGLQYWIKKEKKYKQKSFHNCSKHYGWHYLFYEYFIDSFDFSIWSKKIVLFFIIFCYHCLYSIFYLTEIFSILINYVEGRKNQNCIGSLFSTEKYEWRVWTGPFFLVVNLC